jgi:hypothetical protein
VDKLTGQGVAEATGDKPFDKMMTTIKQGTNKQKTADRKEQQKQTQQRARDAFGNMFGGGNPADKLSIRKGVAEGYVPINIYKGPTNLAPQPKKVEPEHKYVDNRVEVEKHYQARANLFYNVITKSDGKVINPEPIKGLRAAEEFRKQNGLGGANANIQQVWPDEQGVAEGGLELSHKRNRFKALRNMHEEEAEELNIGDPVIITGNVEFNGMTGDVYDFGTDKRFVVVDLYNHGKHSFHSSDVGYNDHVDHHEDEVDEGMYQYNKADPFNSEFAPEAGMGRMTLRGWKESLARRVAKLARELESSSQDGNIDKDYLWDNVYKKLQGLNLDPIAQEIELAHQELENIRKRGGVRSRAFTQNVQ